MGMGERLRQVRGKLSQLEFGRRIGVSQGSVRNYEIGERAPEANTIVRICQEFGVSAQWLLGLPEETGVLPIQDDIPSPENRETPAKAPERDGRDDLIAALRENANLLKENGELKVELERMKAQVAELKRQLN